MKIRFGTRGSALARKQTDMVIEHLKSCLEADKGSGHGVPEFKAHIEIIKTSGDWTPGMEEKRLSSDKGGKGQFTNALENALLNGDIDIAVHSLKDVPSDISHETSLSHFLVSGEDRDVFISNKAGLPDDLPKDAVIGTASLRREALIRHLWPHLDVQVLRGNVPTRLEKLDDGQVDGLILAGAGLMRLGLEDRVQAFLSAGKFVPCAGQGIIGLQTMKNSSQIQKILKPLSSHISAQRAFIERGFLSRINGSCHTPIGINARHTPRSGEQEGPWHIYLFIGDPQGRYQYIRSWVRDIPDIDAAWRCGARLAGGVLEEIEPLHLKELGLGPYKDIGNHLPGQDEEQEADSAKKQ